MRKVLKILIFCVILYPEGQMKNFFPEETGAEKEETKSEDDRDSLEERDSSIFISHCIELTKMVEKEGKFFRALAKLSINSN